MPSLHEADTEDCSVRLPANASTTIAEDLRVRLVLAADLDDELVIDASESQSIGQAVLQLLLAARREAADRGQSFTIANPSPAFLQRISACGLAELLGMEEEVSFQ